MIRSILTRFHRLEKFFFGCVNTFQLGEVTDHLDTDFETVISWGNACPTLYEITLPCQLCLSKCCVWHANSAQIVRDG